MVLKKGEVGMRNFGPHIYTVYALALGAISLVLKEESFLSVPEPSRQPNPSPSEDFLLIPDCRVLRGAQLLHCPISYPSLLHFYQLVGLEGSSLLLVFPSLLGIPSGAQGLLLAHFTSLELLLAVIRAACGDGA